MKIFGKDLSIDVAVIAEVGVNHEGSVEKASELLHQAAKAGADAVKFQSYTTSRFISSADPARTERVTRFGLDESAHRRLAAEAKEAGIVFFSAAISEDWVPLLDELCPVIKIASGDLTFEPVIKAAAATGKPIILSTGCGTVEEIDQAVSWFRDEVGEGALAHHLALMHCVSAYPTPIEQANIRSVPFLAERYGLTTGYSNHVIGSAACLTAVALGASLIEVHFTDQKAGRDFRDHELSFEPSELAALIDDLAAIRQSLGVFGKSPQPGELSARDAIRKGLVAASNLPSGKILEKSDIQFARPASGIRASDIGQAVGKTLNRDLSSGESIQRDDLNE
jgi:N,N'-diacetyllegionaminate synthase